MVSIGCFHKTLTILGTAILTTHLIYIAENTHHPHYLSSKACNEQSESDPWCQQRVNNLKFVLLGSNVYAPLMFAVVIAYQPRLFEFKEINRVRMVGFKTCLVYAFYVYGLWLCSAGASGIMLMVTYPSPILWRLYLGFLTIISIIAGVGCILLGTIGFIEEKVNQYNKERAIRFWRENCKRCADEVNTRSGMLTFNSIYSMVDASTHPADPLFLLYLDKHLKPHHPPHRSPQSCSICHLPNTNTQPTHLATLPCCHYPVHPYCLRAHCMARIDCPVCLKRIIGNNYEGEELL